MKETSVTIVERFIQEFKNKANHAVVDELMAENFIHHFKDPRLPPGRDAMKALGMAISSGFPDVQVTVEDLLACEDKVVERTTARGTHNGSFNGIPPTGKSVLWTEIHIYELRDGKITKLWSEVDMLAILIQIGALPMP